MLGTGDLRIRECVYSPMCDIERTFMVTCLCVRAYVCVIECVGGV